MDHIGLINKSQAAKKSKGVWSTDQAASLKKERDFCPRGEIFLFSLFTS